MSTARAIVRCLFSHTHYVFLVCLAPLTISVNATALAQATPAQKTESDNPLEAVFGAAIHTPVQDAPVVERPNVSVPPRPADAPPTSGKEATKGGAETSFAAAVRQAQLSNRPLLVVLGAPWCPPCRMLDRDLSTEEGKAVLSQWYYVHVNVDDEPEIAARFDATSIPALRILGPSQNVVASRVGYVSLAELKRWLADNRTSADLGLRGVLFATTTPTAEELKQLLSLFGEASPAIRGAAIDRLAAHPGVAAEPLVELLQKGRLSEKLAALEALRRLHAPVNEIDPWQPDTLHDDLIASLAEWSRERRDSPAVAPALPTASTLSVGTSADELLRRLTQAAPEQRQGLIAQLTGIGPALAPEVRTRLVAADALSDTARENLRELLYSLLASPQTRLQQPGVVSALARLDAELHRLAAASVLDTAPAEDRPLIDELSADSDPLVRELAIRALGRLGALSDKDHIGRLLTDSSANARTAVLSALKEHPSPQAVQILCDYLARETNEDLLVHGAKTLGQLPNEPQALVSLGRLAAGESWRVRAAAIEATGQVIDGASSGHGRVHFSISGSSNNQPTLQLPPELVSAILAAAAEKDAFVAKQAVTILPKLISGTRLENDAITALVVSLADNPPQLDLLLKEVPEAAREQSLASLIKLSKQWISEGGEQNVERQKQTDRAILLLSRIAPSELTDRLAALIGSTERPIRMAGLRATLHAAAALRQSQYDAAASLFENDAIPAMLRSERKAITPWHDSPGGAANPPQPAKERPDNRVQPAADTHAQNVEPNRANDALTAISNFFGGAAPTSMPKDESSNNSQDRAPAKPVTDGMAAVEALFGDLSQPALVIEISKPSPGNVAVGGAKISPFIAASSKPGQLPSEWLAHWQGGDASARPEWLKACDGPTSALFASGNPEERAGALAVWLVLGHTDRVDELLASIKSLESAKDSYAVELAKSVLSWLPSDARLAECQRQVGSNKNNKAAILAALTEATLVDDEQIAKWVLDYAADPAGVDDDFRDSLVEILLRARVGPANSKFLNYLSADEYTYETRPPFQVVKSNRPADFPGRREACEWLREKYQNAANDRKRAIALLAVAKLDHLTAVNAAIRAAQDNKDESPLLDVALAIAFSDSAAPVSGRAAALLSHPARSARGAAVRALTLPPRERLSHRSSGVPVVYDYGDALPGFWRVKDSLPVDALHAIVENSRGDDKDSQSLRSLGRLLLLSTGEATDVPQLEKDVHNQLVQNSKLCIATALAKAGRADEEAVAFYESTYAELTSAGEEQMSAGLYEVLRGLESERIAELRRKMRSKGGSGLLERLFGR